jgi:Ca2+-binding RTX toxin-like protein
MVIESAGDGPEDLVVSSVAGYTLSADVEALILTGVANLGTGNSLDNTLTGNTSLGNTLYGGGGEDTFIGGSEGDWFIVDSSGDSVSGGGGIDSVVADVDGYTLGGGAEWLVFGTASTGYGNASNNTLVGNSMSNTLNGGAGADSMAGGSGNDYYIIDNLGDLVLEQAAGGASDTIFVDVSGYTIPSHIENIVISGNVVSVTGSSTANLLAGNSLDNTLDGGGGADTLIGGEGNDFYILDNVGDVVQELGGQGTDSVLANVISSTLPGDVEFLGLGTSAVTGVGNTGNNTIIGNTSYNSLVGGGGNDWVEGGGGTDTLVGGSGNDTMIGGSGNDWFSVDAVGDSLVGGGGTDGIIAEIDGYTLNAAFSNVVAGTGAIYSVTGNAGNNSVIGNSLMNTLSGGAGDDTLMGKGQSDYYFVNSAGDLVVEVNGEGSFDTVEFSVAGQAYALPGFVERLVLAAGTTHGTGNSLNNTLAGNADANSLSGGAGRDSLSGGSGADTLLGAIAASTGGRGEIDTLTGGADADVFVLGTTAGVFYNDGLSSNTGTADYALITDFNAGEDVLQMRSGTYYFGASNGSYQELFLELGTTDEVVARLQGTSLSTTAFSSGSQPSYVAFV